MPGGVTKVTPLLLQLRATVSEKNLLNQQLFGHLVVRALAETASVQTPGCQSTCGNNKCLASMLTEQRQVYGQPVGRTLEETTGLLFLEIKDLHQYDETLAQIGQRCHGYQ